MLERYPLPLPTFGQHMAAALSGPRFFRPEAEEQEEEREEREEESEGEKKQYVSFELTDKQVGGQAGESG